MREMRKRKEIQNTDTLIEQGDTFFFACYLLTSLCPRFKGHTYIGYTLNPRRRIRQHNGEIGSGAWRTKSKRPWEMVLCIYGFPTNVAALQFEWAWQHPVESLAVRNAAASFKSLSGLANKIKLAYTMLTLPPWQSLNLTVNLFSTKYQSYITGCPTLPDQMRTQICSMDELPCYNVNVNAKAGLADEWNDSECEGSLLDSSTLATRKLNDSPSYVGTSEENVTQRINHTDDSIVESSECVAETWAGWSKKLPSISEDDRCPSFIIIDDNMESPMVVESTTEFSEPLKKQSTTALAADNDQVFIKSRDIISHEVEEIIDVFTPSPCHPVNSGSKKRRRNLGCEIIDLTNSPLFV